MTATTTEESCKIRTMTGARIDIKTCLLSEAANGQSLQGDLYLPPAGESNRPAVVLVFGGSWKSGDRTQQKAYGLALAKAGFVCLATDYRLSSEAHWPAQLCDVRVAIRWLRAHAADYAVDPRRIAVSGNSSGGHLALMAAATAAGADVGELDDRDWAAQSSEISAVCAFYPPTELTDLDRDSADDTVSQLLGPDKTRADAARASPLSHANTTFPPLLLISGGTDLRVPVSHSHRLQAALEASGNTVELHVFAQQGHAFDADRDFAQLCGAIMVQFFKRFA